MKPLTCNSRLVARHRCRGFTFIEVLFATIILGLGFIMIAAVFPAALQQSLTTSDETAGTLVCQDALRQIQTIANDTNLPYPGVGYSGGTTPSTFSPMVPLGNFSFPNNNSITANPIAALAGNEFFSADRRYAWVAFYRRISATDPMAQVVVIALKSTNFTGSNFNIPPPVAPFTGYSTLNPTTTGPHVNLAPLTYTASTITADLQYSQATNTSYIFLPDSINYTNNLQAVYNNATVTEVGGVPYAPGAYVIINDDPLATASTPTGNTPPGSLIGRVFRLGSSITSLPSDVLPPTDNIHKIGFQLQPGMDLVAGPGGQSSPGPYSREQTGTSSAPTYVPVYVVGQFPSYNSTDQAYDGPYSGGNIAIAATTGYIKINN
jgi:type II secretory pathway pseudopilin PulG